MEENDLCHEIIGSFLIKINGSDKSGLRCDLLTIKWLSHQVLARARVLLNSLNISEIKKIKMLFYFLTTFQIRLLTLQ